MTKRQRIILEAQRALKRSGKPKLAAATRMLRVKAREQEMSPAEIKDYVRELKHYAPLTRGLDKALLEAAKLLPKFGPQMSPKDAGSFRDAMEDVRTAGQKFGPQARYLANLLKQVKG